MPQHNYIFVPTRGTWPASSVNARIRPIKLINKDGEPSLDKDGNPRTVAATVWLDRHKPVEQMTWAPGMPMIIAGRILHEGGWIDRTDVACFNLYVPPTIEPGDPAKADKWIEHVHYIYPEEAEHIINWLAHRVQKPQEKINHALFLGGNPGIGKDTLLEPVKHAVGPWNFQEAVPKQVLGRFNSFLKGVILRINEARDLGEFDRYQFYDHMKAYTAAPPDVLRCDEKNLREHPIVNVCGVIITTNYKDDGIFLPADDRRHFVAWSDLTNENGKFQNGYWNEFWRYYKAGGMQHVTAYLLQRDISNFDPKAPPKKTDAFWAIVDNYRPSEEAELADLIDLMGRPAAFTLAKLQGIAGSQGQADGAFNDWLKDRKNRRVVPHRLEKCGYAPVRNPDANDGLWVIRSRRQVVYAKSSLSTSEKTEAARKLQNPT